MDPKKIKFPTPPKPKKKTVNYALIEPGWRAGIATPKDLSDAYFAETGQKVSRTAITKHFTLAKVPRDLGARIKHQTSQLVAKTLVSHTGEDETKVTDDEIVESAAKQQFEVVMRHRTQITRFRTLAANLLTELEVATKDPELFKELGFCLRSEDQKGVDKLNDIYHRVISTPGRIASFKQLADTLKTLIGLERQAFGMADNANGDADSLPPEPTSPHDAARRVAFLLTMSAKQKG